MRAPIRRSGTVGRLLAFAAPDLSRFAGAWALGVLAVVSVVFLMAASAWLISAASLQPPLLVLSLAIVGVRAFALGRAGFRYLERLVAHDVAFRLLARLRVRFYRHLEPLAPAGLAEFRHGDLLARMVGDVDAVQDLSLRVLQPAVVAAAAATASVGLVAVLLPSAAAVLLTALLVAALAVPAATAWAGARAESRLAGARSELTADVVALLRAAPDLIAFDAAAAHLDRIDARDGE
ncbi:MAG: glutathione/cysteine ABC transporter permease/ATPase, partial [Pseudonocardia sp.]|nr:glutathione/cysteine ABC transporter permease/ATPase [Pseudonocardia sp.]